MKKVPNLIHHPRNPLPLTRVLHLNVILKTAIRPKRSAAVGTDKGGGEGKEFCAYSMARMSIPMVLLQPRLLSEGLATHAAQEGGARRSHMDGCVVRLHGCCCRERFFARPAWEWVSGGRLHPLTGDRLAER